MEKEMIELKPCQCGSSEIFLKPAGISPKMFYVECLSCGMRTKIHATPTLASDSWNTRPIEDALLKALKDAVDYIETHNPHLGGEMLDWVENLKNIISKAEGKE